MLDFSCPSCRTKFSIFEGEDRPTCCGAPVVHHPSRPTATVREVVDTGLMARRLEVVANVVDLQRIRDSETTIK